MQTPETWINSERLASYGRQLRRALLTRSAISYAAMFIGVALIAYVTFEYVTMVREQHRLVQQWDENTRRAAEKGAAPVDDGLIRLSIPKIDLDVVVVEGTSSKRLLVGPGHLEHTALPGETGNSVISAHRDTFFRHVHELTKGDLIDVKRAGSVYEYEVTGKKIVNPDDVSVIRPTKDAQLTLITCYPTYFIGPAPERLIIFSKLVKSDPLNMPAPQPASAPAAALRAAAKSN